MAATRLATLYYDVEARTAKLDNALGGADERVKKFDDSVKATTKSLLTFAALQKVLQGIQKFFSDSIRLFREAHDINKKLEAIIKVTGQSAGFTTREIKKMASAWQSELNISDEVIKNSFAIGATFKSISGEALPRMVRAALDMSKAFGQDAQQSTIMLGKAMENLEIGPLQRVGVSVDEATKKMIEGFKKSGRTAEAQKLILAAVEGQVKGVAKAMAQDAVGSWDKLALSFADMQEVVGKLLTEGFEPLALQVQPLIVLMTNFLELFSAPPDDELTQAMREHNEELNRMFSGGRLAEASINSLTSALKRHKQALKDVISGLISTYETRKRINAENERAIAELTKNEIEVLKKARDEEIRIATEVGANVELIRKKYEILITNAKRSETDARKKIDAENSEAIKQLTLSELELLAHRRDTEIAEAKKTGANVKFIKEKYSLLITQKEAEIAQKQIDIEARKQEKLEKLEAERRAKQKAMADKALEDAKRQAEREVQTRKKALDKQREVEQQAHEQRLAEYREIGETISSYMQDTLVAIGEALVEGADAWDAVLQAGKEAVAKLLEALGQMAIAEAAAALAKGDFIGVGLWSAASIAAFIGSGVVRALATGGLAVGPTIVGERGLETIDFKTPTKVYNTTQTKNITGQNVYNVNVTGIGSHSERQRAFSLASHRIRSLGRRF